MCSQGMRRYIVTNNVRCLYPRVDAGNILHPVMAQDIFHTKYIQRYIQTDVKHQRKHY